MLSVFEIESIKAAYKDGLVVNVTSARKGRRRRPKNFSILDPFIVGRVEAKQCTSVEDMISKIETILYNETKR